MKREHGIHRRELGGDPWLRVIVKFAGCLWGGSNGPVECSNTVEEICRELESARQGDLKHIRSGGLGPRPPPGSLCQCGLEATPGSVKVVESKDPS